LLVAADLLGELNELEMTGKFGWDFLANDKL
jgi:hypothetical protein